MTQILSCAQLIVSVSYAGVFDADQAPYATGF